MEKLKVAVIGTGHLGSIHAKLWKQNSSAELVGIFDQDTEKANKIASDLSVTAFDSLQSALEHCSAVTIAVPTSMHYETAMYCIEKGVHCLIEKPITAVSSEAKELIKKAKENSVILQVGHVERFNPALSVLKNYKMAPRFIEAHRLSQFKPRAIDVSVIHDLMIHDIDIVLSLFKSEVERIDANGVAILTDTPDIANARITFKNGGVANLTASRISANPMRKLRIFQPGAYISIDFGKQDVEVFKILDEDEPIGPEIELATMLGTLDAGIKNKKIAYLKPNVPEINAIAEEQSAFAYSVMNNSSVAVSAEEAAEALRIAELISEQIM
jgi:predicted dehydrogenase